MNGKKIPDHWRYHYRYRAADIALQAGDLAQNSDLKALLNYSAGTMLANRSPQEADVFYKRLVRQCQGSILAEAADQARWFPQNEVLAKEQKDLKYLNTLQEVRQLIQALP